VLFLMFEQLMPTASERLIWGFGDESTLSVVKVPLKSSGETALASAGVCWENLVPMLRQHFYNQGTQLYCAPTVDGREGWLSSMRHIAMEGRCFVLSACQVRETLALSFCPSRPLTHSVLPFSLLSRRCRVVDMLTPMRQSDLVSFAHSGLSRWPCQ
jgi:hypothetical protein